MSGFRARWRRWTAGWGSALLAGALWLLVIGRLGGEGHGKTLPLLLFGALYGLAVLGLLRLFGTRGFGLVVAGALSGPVPAVLLFSKGAAGDDRGAMWLAGVLIGVAIGVLEWMRPPRGAGEPPAAER